MLLSWSVVNVLLALGLSPAFGGDAESGDAAAALAPVVLPPEVARTVESFVGKWKLSTSMTPPGGQAIVYPESIRCDAVALGRAVACTDTGSIPDMGPFEYRYLISFDVATSVVHLYSVGSSGEVHDHRCTWQGTTMLACEPLSGTTDQGPVTETFSFTFDGAAMVMEGTVEMGGERFAMRATATRK